MVHGAHRFSGSDGKAGKGLATLCQEAHARAFREGYGALSASIGGGECRERANQSEVQAGTDGKFAGLVQFR